MRGSEHGSVEELVMSSARTYLYGHSLAWAVPGQPDSRPSRSTRRNLFAAVRDAGRVALGRRRAVAVEPAGCA